MNLPRPLRKFLGILLLWTAIGAVSCQSMLEARIDHAPDLRQNRP